MQRKLLYLLFTLGGFAALVYEVAWMRSFSLVFGSSTSATAAVLAAFFVGMGVGNVVGGRIARRPAPLRAYGLMELAVGATALLVVVWLAVFDALYVRVYDALGPASAVLTALRVVLALVSIGPPAAAMGATLPLMARALVEREDHIAARTGLLYALNTIGATCGVLAAAFALPLRIGMSRIVYVAAAVNALIGLSAMVLARRRIRTGRSQAAGQAPRRRAPAAVLLAAGVSGFGALALEVLYTRLLTNLCDGSVYSFAAMLATFLVFLALGSVLVARVVDRSTTPWRFLAWTQLGAVCAILLSPALFPLAPRLIPLSQDSAAMSLLGLVGMAALVLGPAVLLVGTVLPTTWVLATTNVGELGARVGGLTGVNTIAAAAGSLVAGFVLMPRLGTGAALAVVAGLYAVLALAAWWIGYRGVGRAAGLLLVVLVAGGGTWARTWRVMPQQLEEGERLVAYYEGPAASVAVVQRADGHFGMKLNNTYTLGSTASVPLELRQGRLPLLLHPGPRRVAFIGPATGVSLSAVLDFPVERAVAVELVPGVVEAARSRYFATANRHVYDDPRVTVLETDGRNYLHGTHDTFDVIISDLFVPWHAGTGYLYTVEHFRAVAERLAPGGLFAQWLPGHQLSGDELRMIVASFQDAFPATAMWRAGFVHDYPLLCLVGYRDGLALDPAALNRRIETLAAARPIADTFLADPVGVALLYISGGDALRAWAVDAPRNTDDAPRIEFIAPRTLYRQHREFVEATAKLLADLGPSEWAYPQPPATRIPLAGIFEAAHALQLAAYATARSDFNREFEELRRVLDLVGDVPAVQEYAIAVAERYARRQMIGRAEALLDVIVAGDRPPDVAMLQLGNLLERSQREDDAIRVYEQAVAKSPDLLPAHEALIRLYRTAGRLGDAEPHLRRVLEARPKDWLLRAEWAASLDKLGRTDDARREIETIKRDADYAQRRDLWRYIRSLGLGAYLDAPSTAPAA